MSTRIINLMKQKITKKLKMITLTQRVSMKTIPCWRCLLLRPLWKNRSRSQALLLVSRSRARWRLPYSDYPHLAVTEQILSLRELAKKLKSRKLLQAQGLMRVMVPAVPATARCLQHAHLSHKSNRINPEIAPRARESAK